MPRLPAARMTRCGGFLAANQTPVLDAVEDDAVLAALPAR